MRVCETAALCPDEIEIFERMEQLTVRMKQRGMYRVVLPSVDARRAVAVYPRVRPSAQFTKYHPPGHIAVARPNSTRMPHTRRIPMSLRAVGIATSTHQVQKLCSLASSSL